MMNIRSFILASILLPVTISCAAAESKQVNKYAGFEFEPINSAISGQYSKDQFDKFCRDFTNSLYAFYKKDAPVENKCQTKIDDYSVTKYGVIVSYGDRLFKFINNNLTLVDTGSVPEGFYPTNHSNQYGCLINYRVFAQDIDLDGLEEIFWFYGNVYESPKLYKTSEYLTRYEIDLHIYSGETLENIISTDFVEENYKSEQNKDSPVSYQASAFPDNNVPYKERDPSYRHLAKLYVADLDEDGLINVLIWRRDYESRLKTDPVKGFKFVQESFSHWEETKLHQFEKQQINNEQGEKWLLDNGLTWKDGFPKETFCQHQPEANPVVLQRVISDYDDKLDQPIYDETLNLNDPVLEK